MLSGMCPSSPAMLCLPRSISPLTTTPMPRPSDTETKTKSPGGCIVPAGRPQLRERARLARVLDVHRQAGRRRQVSRIGTSCQPSRGRKHHPLPVAIHHAGHDHADALASADVAMLGQQRGDPLGQRLDEPLRIGQRGKLEMPTSGVPTRSVTIRYVRIWRMSTAITHRLRESM